MIALQNGRGETCATARCFAVSTVRQALAVVWSDLVAGEPDRAQALSALQRLIDRTHTRAVQAIETRVINQQANLEVAAVSSRAAWLRSLVLELGFEHVSNRIEYRLPLEDAIARAEAAASPPRLRWTGVATEPGEGIERAARIVRDISDRKQESTAKSDPVGYLLSRRDDPELFLPPDSLQIGTLNDDDVAVVAASVVPTTGWCSLFYFGIIPELRGRGYGTEAMLHGLRALRAMGGRIYHDGTDAGNEPMLALFRRLGAPCYSAIEEWELTF